MTFGSRSRIGLLVGQFWQFDPGLVSFVDARVLASSASHTPGRCSGIVTSITAHTPRSIGIAQSARNEMLIRNVEWHFVHSQILRVRTILFPAHIGQIATIGDSAGVCGTEAREITNNIAPTKSAISKSVNHNDMTDFQQLFLQDEGSDARDAVMPVLNCYFWERSTGKEPAMISGRHAAH